MTVGVFKGINGFCVVLISRELSRRARFEGLAARGGSTGPLGPQLNLRGININYSGSKRKDKNKLIKATTTTMMTTTTITGAKERHLYTPEFSDYMVRTSLVANWLTLTLHLPNRVRELELQELHGFKSTPSNQSNRQDPVQSNYGSTMEIQD